MTIAPTGVRSWKTCRTAFNVYLHDDSGQSTTEFILIIGLISVPMYLLFREVFFRFLSRFVTRLVTSLTMK